MKMMLLLRLVQIMLVLSVVSCAPGPDKPFVVRDTGTILLDPSKDLDDSWEQMVFGRGQTSYEQSSTRHGDAIRATANSSASIIYKVFDGIELSCNTLEWDWFVEGMQETSDLRQKGLDDVAASIMVSFGDPGFFRDKPVPVLKYVWANQNHVVNDIIVGPYQEETIRTIVVRSGVAPTEGMMRERRNLVADFEIAFGKMAGDRIYAIGLFTDNDDTKEAITAYYGRIALTCAHRNN